MGLNAGMQIAIISPGLDAASIIEAGTVPPCLSPATVHLSLIVLSSSKDEFSFTSRPNPYNGFDRGSSFPVTVFMTNPRWTDAARKTLTPSRGSAVKITGVITSVHPDGDGVNHWVVIASEIFFLKDSLSKPAVPGTGEFFPYSHSIRATDISQSRQVNLGRYFLFRMLPQTSDDERMREAKLRST